MQTSQGNADAGGGKDLAAEAEVSLAILGICLYPAQPFPASPEGRGTLLGCVSDMPGPYGCFEYCEMHQPAS